MTVLLHIRSVINGPEAEEARVVNLRKGRFQRTAHSAFAGFLAFVTSVLVRAGAWFAGQRRKPVALVLVADRAGVRAVGRQIHVFSR